jgi:atypical protein kinase C iota type
MMPVVNNNNDSTLQNDIKVKIAYNGEVLIFYIAENITYEELCKEIRGICRFAPDQVFTMKWIDEENDPCTISCQMELNEAIRLYEVNRDSELFIHVFPNSPAAPGLSCIGEDRSIYRRGARRWRKLYRINGHIFQAKRFNRRAFCAFCHDRIWGLGRQGFKCIQCKLLVHKKCHKLVQKPCNEQAEPIIVSNGESEQKLNQPVAETTTVEYHESGDGDQVAVEPTSVANSGEPLEPGSQRQYSIADFELIRVIGRGSYAKVLMVELRKTKRIYAMKVIKKALVTDDEDIDWVQTEKHVFETASNHPFLVGLHSCFQTPSRLFFVIEFVRGGDLMFHMQRQRRLPEEHARFYAAEISLALNFLHEKGIIYRDLKLDNVLLDHEGHIKLTDYGMCKEGIKPGDTTATFCGTPNCEYSPTFGGFSESQTNGNQSLFRYRT